MGIDKTCEVNYIKSYIAGDTGTGRLIQIVRSDQEARSHQGAGDYIDVYGFACTAQEARIGPSLVGHP